MADRTHTEAVTHAEETTIQCQKLRVTVVAGMDKGLRAEAVEGRLTVGTAEGATLRLTDATVSRFHLECEVQPRGVLVRDLGSRNGTVIAGLGVREVLARSGVELTLGRTQLRLQISEDTETLHLSRASSFGVLVGAAPAMRRLYAVLAQAAPTRASVLLTGESGTGKELAARSLHDASDRRSGPFEVVDCGGLPAALIEGELFGHERGAFTGATAARAGAFERADGGTIFLDELGELALELQPKLLRFLAEGELRRLGGAHSRKVDVRVVAATHRDLRREVNEGRFRADLFYRVAVLQLRMPALRERLEDLPLLVPHLLRALARPDEIPVELAVDDPLWQSLRAHDWQGNVRELRNVLEQWLVLRSVPALALEAETASAPAPETASAPAPEDFSGLDALPFSDAKARVLERFEQHYVARLLAQTGGNVAEAARRSGVDRATLFRLIRRHGLREH